MCRASRVAPNVPSLHIAKDLLASATALNTLMLAPHVLFSLNPVSNMEKPHSQQSLRQVEVFT